MLSGKISLKVREESIMPLIPTLRVTSPLQLVNIDLPSALNFYSIQLFSCTF